MPERPYACASCDLGVHWNFHSKTWNFSQIPEISSIFRIFLALFLNLFRTLTFNVCNFLEFFMKFRQNFIEIWQKNNRIHLFLLEWEWKLKWKYFIPIKFRTSFFLKFWGLSGAKECISCRSRKILKNAPTLAIVAVGTAENEPLKIWGWFHSCFN